METPKKTDKKTSSKKKKPAETSKLNEKAPSQVKAAEPRVQNSFIDDQDDDFDVPLDELEGFDTFNEYDEDDDY